MSKAKLLFRLVRQLVVWPLSRRKSAASRAIFLLSSSTSIGSEVVRRSELINTSRALTSGLWCTMKVRQRTQCTEWPCGSQQTRTLVSYLEKQLTLACLASRRYTTYDKVDTANPGSSSNTTSTRENIKVVKSTVTPPTIQPDEANDITSVTSSTSTQILSKLFPQTSLDLDNEEARERRRKEEEEEQQELERAWTRMKFGFGAFGIGGIIASVWSLYYFGRPQYDEDGNELRDEFSDLPVTQQYAWRTWTSINSLQRFIQEPSSMKLLPDPLKPPYIQPPYTLVLELKDLLIHPDWTYETGWRFKKRPGVDIFLRECAKYFEVVVFTAEQGITVFPLLDSLDPNGYIMYRLVRDSTHFVDGHHVKNLDNLNRDLKRVIVIDWDKNATKMHPENCFAIPRWNGNDDDTTLYDLISFLGVLGNSDVDDVREVLNYYKQFNDPIMQFRENQKRLMEQMEEREQQIKSRSKPIVKKWSRGFAASTPALQPPPTC